MPLMRLLVLFSFYEFFLGGWVRVLIGVILLSHIAIYFLYLISSSVSFDAQYLFIVVCIQYGFLTVDIPNR